jgi:hypothetical protein
MESEGPARRRRSSLPRVLVLSLISLVAVLLLAVLTLAGYAALSKRAVYIGFGSFDFALAFGEPTDFTAVGLPSVNGPDPSTGRPRCDDPQIRLVDVWQYRVGVFTCARWSRQPAPPPVPTVPVPLPRITGVPTTIPAAPIITTHPSVPPPTRDVSKPTER